MTDTTMDAGAKAKVKEALLAHARGQLVSNDDQVGTEESAARLDQDSSFSADDQSQAYEAGDLTALFERLAAAQLDQVAAMEALDFSVTEVVRPGAIVGFGGGRFVVGAVADSFVCGDASYEGISADAPIFAEIEGKKVGDTFSFRDHEHTIDFVA